MNALSSVFGIKNNFQATAPVNKFKADPAQLDTSNYAPTIQAGQTQAAGGAGPAQDTIQRQGALSDMLTASANGTGGPSAAQTMLNQQTQNNINTAAGGAASARGVNPAMAARMAVDSAGRMNQETAGTAATLRANEQLAAREQLGRNLAQTGATQLGQQATGAQVLGTAGNLQNTQNTGQIQNTLGTNQINANVAEGNANRDLGAQQINAGVAAQNTSTNAGMFGGMLNGAGQAASMAMLAAADGGEVPRMPQVAPTDPAGSYLHRLHGYADGGPVDDFMFQPMGAGAETPTDLPASTSKQPFSMPNAGDSLQKAAATGMDAFRNFTGMRLYGAPYATGGSIYADPAGPVPGRAQVHGDSPTNDKVHALLSPGEIVLPRSITQGKNPAKDAATFVASVLRRSGGQKRLANGGKVAVDMDPKGVPIPPTSKLPLQQPAAQVKRVVKGATAPKKGNDGDADDVQDLAEGGMVQPFTARGSGLDETRRRIKRTARKEA